MKKLVMLSLAALVLTLSSPAQAEIGKKGQLGVGGVMGIGGSTPYYELKLVNPFTGEAVGVDDDNGAFVFSLMPEVQYFVIDNLAVAARLPFYEYYGYENRGVDYDIHAFPFMVGVKYLFALPSDPRWRFPVGMDVGFSIFLHESSSKLQGMDSEEIRFSLDFYGGFLYEVIPNLGVGAVFNVAIPNVAPTKDLEVVVGRFSAMATAAYFFGL